MSQRRFLIAPSVLGADPLALAEAVESLGGREDWLHLDIMDGHFVRNLSFGPAVARAMRRRWPDAFIDVHLMVDRLDVVLPLFLDSGRRSSPSMRRRSRSSSTPRLPPSGRRGSGRGWPLGPSRRWSQ